MRILVVTQYFWPEAFRINDLAVALQARGHAIRVLTGVPNYPSGRFFEGYGFFRPSRESFEGIPVARVPLMPRGGRRHWRLALNYVSFALSASVLGPMRVPDDCDVILVYEPSPITVGLPAVLLRSLRGVPVVFWVQDLWPESLAATGAVRSPRVLAAVGRLARFIYRRCDRILVQSAGFVPRVIATGAEPGRVSYLPNWAEAVYRPVDVEADAPERRELPDGFRVMFAGNIGSAQALATLLEAAALVRDLEDVRWVVVGDGHQRPWLEARVREAGLADRVRLIGSRPVEAMPRYLALADALLVTLRRDPAFALTVPTKLQSYLACGRPVLAALDGEGARIVEEAGAGLTSPAEDASALAETVRTLRALPEAERAAMGRRGRAYFERHFEREALITRLEQLMRETAESDACAS